ncbi:MAG: glycosyltransferase family 9 protein [Spirochaetes bacterium]|nr:glycosyltransferase family 9 protein [Spirochaetota bacterium]
MKVLIVKIGWAEFLDERIEKSISLGDVFRSTVVLHLYKNDHVTWLADEHGIPLLRGIKHIDRIVPFDLLSVLQLQSEYFDVVVNLEKVPGICALVNNIKAGKKYGFRLNPVDGQIEAFQGAEKVLSISMDNELKKKLSKQTYQDFLYELLGAKWNGEEYILGYKPRSKEVFDIGLNHHIGAKWPTKHWGSENWDEMEKRLKRKYTVSRQKGLSNIEEYIDWLNSCRLIVTHDSLGLHLALALKKKVVALYGPTFSNEVYMYNRGVKILPPIKRECIPCMNPTCPYKKACIKFIDRDTVIKQIEKYLKKPS